jgi:Dolichyl-phosphate-mannose-protein mannosyltransferase
VGKPAALGPPPEWVAPVVAMVAACAMRIWALHYQPFVTVDGSEYIRIADALAHGRRYATIFPPGYPLLIALSHAFTPDRVRAAALISLITGTLLPWPVWRLARRRLSPPWAFAATMLVALHPDLARFGALAMSEAAYLLALCVALALAAAERPLPTGLALGAAFAIRPEALLMTAALGVRRALARRDIMRALALGSFGFLVCAIPCWLWFHAMLGTWTLSPKLADFHATAADWRVMEPRLATGATPSPGAWRTIAVALAQYPAHALEQGRALLECWPPPLLALSLLALVLAPGALLAIPLLHLLVLPLSGVSAQARLAFPALPALALLAVITLAAAWERRGAWRMAAIGVALAGILWCGVGAAHRFVTPLDNWMGSHQRAGLWLSGVAEPNAVVMDRKPFLAFYAWRPYRVIPDEPYDRLIAAAVRDGVRYLVVDQQIAAYFRPQLEPLLYDAEFRDREPRLELVYVGGGGTGYGLGIFRILRPGEGKSGLAPHVETSYLRDLETIGRGP